MTTDTIADVLTRLRNGQRAGHKTVSIPVSKMTSRVLDVLKQEGFVDAVQRKTTDKTKFEQFEVGLKYYSNGDPAISRLKRVSSPGRRVYAPSDKLPKVHGGLGIAILSTSRGVVSDREAKKLKVGGEILALIG